MLEALRIVAPADSPADIVQALATHHEASFGWALTCCGFERDEAEEVLQTAYLRVLGGQARFGGDSRLDTWFFGVLRLTAAGRRKNFAIRRLALGRWFQRGPRTPVTPTPEHLCDDAQVREHLRSLLASLSARQREVLHLVFYQELTLEQAAAVLAISLGSARRHYDRGKARLRLLLAGAGEVR